MQSSFATIPAAPLYTGAALNGVVSIGFRIGPALQKRHAALSLVATPSHNERNAAGGRA
jgi:hypothetical protein